MTKAGIGNGLSIVLIGREKKYKWEKNNKLLIQLWGNLYNWFKNQIKFRSKINSVIEKFGKKHTTFSSIDFS